MGDLFDKNFYGNTIADWSVAMLIIIGAFVISKILYWLSFNILHKFTSKTKNKLDDILVDMLEEPVVMAIVIGGFWYALDSLYVSPELDHFFSKVFYVAIIFDIAWLIIRVTDSLILKYLTPFVEKTEGNLDDQLLPIIRKSIKVAVWVVAIVVGLNNAGYDVATLIAGLGLGGLALAMAAKDSVSNLFGGFTIFLDKPFKIGDRIRIGDFDGFVVNIGMRSTRLRTLEGRLIVIPNKEFTESFIENISSEPSRKITLSIGLAYETHPSLIEKAIEILKTINSENAKTTEICYAGFDTFGNSHLGITFIYYIELENNFLEVQTQINLEIIKRFTEAGIHFAYPVQIVKLINS